MKITTITNGNLYLNGNNYAGTVDSIKLPDIKQKTQDVMPLGSIGTVQVPAGLEAMEMSMTISAFNDSIINELSDPYKAQNLQVRGEVLEHNANGTTTTRKYVFLATGRCSSITMGDFKAHELVKQEVTFTITSMTIKLDDVEQIHINIMTAEHRVRGNNIKGNYKTNLGL